MLARFMGSWGHRSHRFEHEIAKICVEINTPGIALQNIPDFEFDKTNLNRIAQLLENTWFFKIDIAKNW